MVCVFTTSNSVGSSGPDFRITDSGIASDAGEQFRVIRRLAEEVVGAGRKALDAIRNGVNGADENHGREARRSIALDLPADLEAVQPRHGDIEQHDVRWLLPHGLESLSAVPNGDDGVSMRGEQPLVDPADGLVVIAHQDDWGSETVIAVRDRDRCRL